MPALKLDLIFEARGRGWRETYYGDFPVTNFEEMVPIAKKLAAARIAMAASPVQIKAFAVSDPLTPGRQGQTFNFAPRYSAPTWPGNDGATDPSTAVNVDFQRAGSNKARRIQLRGCPDGIINDFGELTGTLFGAWSQPYEAWRLIMLGQGQPPNVNYGWFARLPVANVDPSEVSYAYAVGATVPTLTFEAGFFPLGDQKKNRYIRIKGLNGGTSSLNGEAVVYVLTDATAKTTKPIALGPMTTTGLATRYAALPTFFPCVNVRISKAGRRAPGAPLGYTPGRRRARRRT